VEINRVGPNKGLQK